ncbi:MAG: GTPase HflX [Pyrinomonadaceae bacterium]|nr:GTPase HflX [Pyrinomonadaceae bacterium]MCX7640331.1 GTPase HflX [Pyrinomonadaceae bacterium]MDW8304758.1 GTPase HflX [Acidobacteriota bacterium]
MIISPELARQISEISHETGRQIGVLINRKGQVEYVMVGDAKKIELPDFGRIRTSQERFRGLRCIHTHLNGEALTQDDLTDLALLRLDLMAVIKVNKQTGLPDSIHAAHLIPTTAEKLTDEMAYQFLPPCPPSQIDINFLTLINSLEEEVARTRQNLFKQSEKDRAILVGVTDGHISQAEESMKELEELARSAEVLVLDKIIQKRSQIDPRTVLGKGKLEELLIRAMRLSADLIIFDTELSPAQIRSISEATDLKVIDRQQLILDIFAQRAKSREGKLQVELAQLRYILPRLVAGQNSAFSRLAGGIGGRGPGETKLEIDRRRVRDRINRLEKEIERLSYQREQRRKNRNRRSIPVVSLVGYTNAGKSTLLNTLTKSKVHAEEKMFATLDPTSRKLRLPHEQEVIINDTVGFIRNLPETLINAFRATLEEISESDLLLHVVDASNPLCLNQIESVEKILTELGYNQIPRIIVLNKIDLMQMRDVESLKRKLELDKQIEVATVSAIRPNTLIPLIEKVSESIRVVPKVYEISAGKKSSQVFWENP